MKRALHHPAAIATALLAVATLCVSPSRALAAPMFATGHMTFPTGTFPYAVAVGDLNGDDRPDLASSRRTYPVQKSAGP